MDRFTSNYKTMITSQCQFYT